ncbi:MAG TPA: aminoacyl-tRNA hydrolase [Bacteroidetes bacterium]|nr:aminoacyl-tRNA hydrolase [Bacteroidota bacterium]
MQYIIGLGNPGSRYKGSRHNVGFEVVDAVASRLRLVLREGKGDYLIAEGSFDGGDVVLIKPLTYMNGSGSAVLDVRERFDAPLEQLLLVCDDFQLPLGMLRLRTTGSDGGHNGLYSVIYHLQSESFPRLRCGIASASVPGDKSLMAEFVLEQFTKEEQPAATAMINKAADACLFLLQHGLTKTMNAFNTKQTT